MVAQVGKQTKDKTRERRKHANEIISEIGHTNFGFTRENSDLPLQMK